MNEGEVFSSASQLVHDLYEDGKIEEGDISFDAKNRQINMSMVVREPMKSININIDIISQEEYDEKSSQEKE